MSLLSDLLLAKIAKIDLENYYFMDIGHQVLFNIRQVYFSLQASISNVCT